MKNLFKGVILSTLVFSTTVFANTYTVKYGDTFLGIALRHGLTQTQLQNLNPSVDIERLKAGTRLEIGNIQPKERSTRTVQQTQRTVENVVTNQPNQIVVDRVFYQQPIQQVQYQPVVQQPINYYQQPIQQVQYQPVVQQPTGDIVIINGQTYLVQPIQKIR